MAEHAVRQSRQMTETKPAMMAQIAERAGVALNTVSYVLSGKRSVRPKIMEHVWSSAVANRGKRTQSAVGEIRRGKPDRLLPNACNCGSERHGKEGVRGSSPREGFSNALLITVFFVASDLQNLQFAPVMEHFWSCGVPAPRMLRTKVAETAMTTLCSSPTIPR